MKAIWVSAEQEWLNHLDVLVERLGEPSRAALLERLVAEKASEQGVRPVRRLPPNKFNPWVGKKPVSAGK